MPERRDRRGEFHWNELHTRDAAESRAFYGAVLGWSFSEEKTPDGAPYLMASAGDGPSAGMMEIRGPRFEGTPEGWFPYVAVDDLDAAIAAAKAAGGALADGPFDIPGGRLAVVRDPRGSAFGLAEQKGGGGSGGAGE